YGAFLATGGILAQHTAEAVREYERELERFAAEGPTDPELAKAKESLIRGLPGALETDDAVASALATTVFNGLPLDYYRTVPGRADEPQTRHPPAGAAVRPGGAATQPGATGSPAQPPAASPVPTPAAPGPGTLPPPTSQQPPPPTRP